MVGPARHIAIVGMSFCGSTVLSYVLGALPEVANVGETHWISTTPLPGASQVMCSACGVECQIMTEDFFETIRAQPDDWYGRIAERIGTQILVTSDKDVNILERLIPDMDLDVIFCFRSPLDSYKSYVRSANLPPEDGSLLSQEQYMWYWTNYYGHCRYNLKVKGKTIWLDFSEFARMPKQQLQRLCRKLDLPYTVNALQYWEKPQHALGGNFNPYDLLSDGRGGRLEIGPRQSEEPTKCEVERFKNHPTASSMYRALQKWAQG